MKIKKNILLISPVAKQGGRELETGFIASTLAKKHNVKVISTSNYYKSSQVLEFSGFEFTSLNKELLQHSFLLRLVAKTLSVKNAISEISHALSNVSLKKKFGVEQKKIKLLEDKINGCDIVFICAQLSSNYLEEIVDFAKRLGKPIYFRTTGTIRERQLQNRDWLHNVTKFIHHSQKNASVLHAKIKVPFTVIDQCAYNEKELLKIPIKEKAISSFFVLSRLSSEKNIAQVISSFNLTNIPKTELNIYGSGPLESELKILAKESPNIHFKGQVNRQEVLSIFKSNDCLIISSKEEAGPLTGIEAMAAGSMILSTKVGAMEERIPTLDIWYDGTEKGLIKKLKESYNTSAHDNFKKREVLRERYLKDYSLERIAQKYVLCIR